MSYEEDQSDLWLYNIFSFSAQGWYSGRVQDSGGRGPGFDNIRILHECQVWIDKSVPRVTIWHHSARASRGSASDAKL